MASTRVEHTSFFPEPTPDHFKGTTASKDGTLHESRAFKAEDAIRGSREKADEHDSKNKR